MQQNTESLNPREILDYPWLFNSSTHFYNFREFDEIFLAGKISLNGKVPKKSTKVRKMRLI